MKKLFAILAVAGVMAACNSGDDAQNGDTTNAAADTTPAVVTPDTTTVTADTTAAAGDTTTK